MKQLTKTEDCINCSDPCCRFYPNMPQFFPIFTKEEVELLIRKGINEDNFYSEDGKHYTIVFKEEEGVYNLCPFVKDKVLCRIYEHRPLDCKMWPFAVIKKEDGIYLAIDSKEFCLPIKRKEGTEEFKEYIKYFADYLESDEMKERLLKYPKLISKDHPDFSVIKRLDKLSRFFF